MLCNCSDGITLLFNGHTKRPNRKCLCIHIDYCRVCGLSRCITDWADYAIINGDF